jgi:hypothetical protein
MACVGLAGCVVPLEPAFSDPSPNHPPYLVQAKPAVTSVVRVSTNANPMPVIEVRLGDQNLQDVLYFRWLLDDPADVADTGSRLLMESALPPSDRETRDPLRFSPNCADHRLTDLPTPRIVLVVADRPFLPPEDAPSDSRWTTANDPGFVLEATWLLAPSCEE